MPRLQRPKFLTCFYCGRKTSTPYDAKAKVKIRRFECPNCEATNYLDENGEITDPPVATDRIATPAKYAVSRPFSPPASPTSATFCATCTKNQYLLSASLAQYLPDPDDPDYAEREKGFYKFRKHQESIYPQICADCLPRVQERLQQAAYTAKTDVLRRMLDSSTNIKQKVNRRSWLGLFDVVGTWLRIAGLVLQLAWHVSLLHVLLANYDADVEMDVYMKLPLSWLLRISGPLLLLLPSADSLIRWSVVASILGAWWNPRFVQIFRGFTKHISGVSKWYTYQAIAVAMRVLLQKVPALTTPDPSLATMQATGHAFAACFATFIYILGPRSIRIDMAPLFGPSLKAPRLQDLPPKLASSRPDEAKSLTELLDEISRTPTIPSSPVSPVTAERPFSRRSPLGYSQALTHRRDDDDLQLNSLDLSAPPVHYEQEMDWSPSQSTHRAFNTYGQRPGQSFSEAPTEPKKGPFWFHVPPAPTTPAQRLFNPPNQPRLRPSPVDKRDFVFRGADGTQLARDAKPQQQKQSPLSQGRDGDESSRQQRVAFAEPSFFPPAPQNDPRNSLASMFGESLALTPSQEEQETGGWLTMPWKSKGGKNKKTKST
ncbi:Ima1 N-terminal domain-containing protein [Podospora appendiculata]|uniref:Ima1 N-terminal domain-containing protein n=1 Tax=Podospora appendiculata TaxID=314037 RepID=A0AAE1C9F5_9PEZI|nr:Ima1 N-terminal domain-containing protein [Podospora appendiculata]